ncbi:hypothetical protein, partial [Klebsiella pneumoniae]|uniref:hypothetical protein n=1 Tax=Klebsiella pneumoniae TaxID=573 RepID=UPI001953FAAB
RANNPLGIARSDRHDPFWVVTRHADIQSVSRQNSLFLNEDKSVTLVSKRFDELMRGVTGSSSLTRSLVRMDAPDHPKY